MHIRRHQILAPVWYAILLLFTGSCTDMERRSADVTEQQLQSPSPRYPIIDSRPIITMYLALRRDRPVLMQIVLSSLEDESAHAVWKDIINLSGEMVVSETRAPGMGHGITFSDAILIHATDKTATYYACHFTPASSCIAEIYISRLWVHDLMPGVTAVFQFVDASRITLIDGRACESSSLL